MRNPFNNQANPSFHPDEWGLRLLVDGGLDPCRFQKPGQIRGSRKAGMSRRLAGRGIRQQKKCQSEIFHA